MDRLIWMLARIAKNKSFSELEKIGIKLLFSEIITNNLCKENFKLYRKHLEFIEQKNNFLRWNIAYVALN